MNKELYLKKYKKDYTEQDLLKLEEGYPVQYIVGHVDFCGIKLKVNQNVLIPRFETEYLVELVSEYYQTYLPKKSNVLEIGTGSGAIAIALLKKNPDLIITATDICPKALAVAKENAQKHQTISFQISNLFENIDGCFDLIVSNPPYLSKQEDVPSIVKDFEPNKALYADYNGLAIILSILKESSQYLAPNGLLALEIGEQQAEYVENQAKKHYPKAKIWLKKDLQNRFRYLFILNNCNKA